MTDWFSHSRNKTFDSSVDADAIHGCIVGTVYFSFPVRRRPTRLQFPRGRASLSTGSAYFLTFLTFPQLTCLWLLVVYVLQNSNVYRLLAKMRNSTPNDLGVYWYVESRFAFVLV